MKRLVYPLLAALVPVMSVSASDPVFDNPDNTPYWGLRVSGDLNVPGDWHAGDRSVKMFAGKPGFSAGVVYNMPLKANLYFEPGLSLFYDAYRYDDIAVTDEYGTVIDKDPDISKWGLRLPLNIGYRFDFLERLSMSVFTGPEVNYAFSGKVKLKYPDEFGSEFPSDLFGEYGQRRFWLGWGFGVGFELDYNLFVSVSGLFGITDLQKNDASFKENRCSVTIGYNF